MRWRRSGIGASDVAGILGLSPWASPYSVWASKMSDAVDDEPSEAMEFGLRAEPMLARWFHDRTGLDVAGEQTWCTHHDNPWAICTVDGFVFDGPNPATFDDALGVAEWKTTSDSANTWAEDGVPDHYACQATWAMYVTGYPVVHFGVLHLAFGRPAFRTYEFHRDAADEAFVVAACEAFWLSHVLTGDAPPTDGHEATTRALRGQWPGTGGVREADLTALELVEEYRYHRAEVKAAETNKAAAANRLLAILGNDVELRWAGRKVASWKPRKQLDVDALAVAWPDVVHEFTTKVDVTAMRKAHPKLVADFDVITEERSLLVPEPKEA